jgi:hypothetical protein
MCTVTRLHDGEQKDLISILDSGMKFSPPSLRSYGSGTYPVSYPEVTETISREVERPEREADVTFPSTS